MKLYLRRERSNDPQLARLKKPSEHYTDIVAYRNKTCTAEAIRWRWYEDVKPRKNRTKELMLGATIYKVVWLEPSLL